VRQAAEYGVDAFKVDVRDLNQRAGVAGGEEVGEDFREVLLIVVRGLGGREGGGGVGWGENGSVVDEVFCVHKGRW